MQNNYIITIIYANFTFQSHNFGTLLIRIFFSVFLVKNNKKIRVSRNRNGHTIIHVSFAIFEHIWRIFSIGRKRGQFLIYKHFCILQIVRSDLENCSIAQNSDSTWKTERVVDFFIVQDKNGNLIRPRTRKQFKSNHQN